MFKWGWFNWHCLGDTAVPCKSTKNFVEKLTKNNVKCEMLLFNSDVHGWGIATNTIASDWPKKC